MNELEVRCMNFAKNARDFCRTIQKDIVNTVYIKQLVRSSSSIGANYIEANEKLGKQDLLMRLRISRKEAKETEYWIELLKVDDRVGTSEILQQEAGELRKILSAIINKLKG
jgi:four helix bundle protein